MANEEIEELTGGAKRAELPLQRLHPTLFIGVGGTGMEVLMRVRRHIINEIWGTGAEAVRIDSLADFPVAEFINFDLDRESTSEKDKAEKDDPIYDLVKFTDEEQIVERLDLDKYCRDDDSLGKYPHIQGWFPLPPKRVRELNIDPENGTGQIRGISRLYFFDKYTKTRELIRLKLQSLKNGLSNAERLHRLGLELQPEKFRIVVVCSGAGGTGSGTFLDMGWLAKWIAKRQVGQAQVDLVMLLPTSFQGTPTDKGRTEANGYAALTELETAMRGDLGQQFVSRWDEFEKPQISAKPYDEVYLIDSGNLASQHTGNISDVYQMTADALFEDFASADFAKNKRSAGSNKRRHKIDSYYPPVTVGRYNQMKLVFHKGFSSFGQSVMDTQTSYRQDMRANVWAGEMLKAFFGVGAQDHTANRSIDKQRDSFMENRMKLTPIPFTDFPDFAARNVVLRRATGEFTDFLLIEELLTDKQGSLVAGLQQRVDDRMEAIKDGFARTEWGVQVRETVRQLEQDAIRNQDANAEVAEDRVIHQRKLLFAQMKDEIRNQLYAYLDNKEFGGLEYVLSLVQQIKERLSNVTSGLIDTQLLVNVARYEELRDAVRTHEYERLMNNLAQTKGSFFGGSGEKQALVIMDQLKTEIANFLKFHLRAKASREAAGLMTDLSKWLGDQSGSDADGQPLWNGLVGELQAGRAAVVEMIGTLQQSVEKLKLDLKKDHATYIQIEAPEVPVPLPNPEVLRGWADESFKDLGGSKALFQMLVDPAERATLLRKVKRMAERQISILAGREAEKTVDPLIEALENMTAQERHRRFSDLLLRAMPWIDANLAQDFHLEPDQYSCFIGVSDAGEFERRFRAEINACVPTRAGITSKQIGIVATGVQGRAVCYCEVSGIPLTILRGLETWRVSYLKAGEKIPTHTHIDTSQFTPPLVPTMEELGALADDFKSYLLAIMTGVLVRVPTKSSPPGQYMFALQPGEFIKIGNERSVRRSGLLPNRVELIVERVDSLVAGLGRLQLAALATLAGVYESSVYKRKKVVINDDGAEDYRTGFAGTMAGEAVAELTARAKRKGFTDAEFNALRTDLLERLASWTTAIEGSDADAYEWEVADRDPDVGPLLKYAIRKEFLKEDGEERFEELLGGSVAGKAANGAAAPAGSSASASARASTAGHGIPAPPSNFTYHLFSNGEVTDALSREAVQTMLTARIAKPFWLAMRSGMKDWVALSDLPEFEQPGDASGRPAPPGGKPQPPGGA